MGVELEQYELIRWAVASPLIYTGKVARDGRWIVTRYNTTTGVIEFSRGSVDFSTNWTNRATLTYAEFDSEF